ncbi:hypothetical protein JW613_21870 [Streptomyces smyrnaeus]|uniref:Secreted protein n=1 Tax=Streptomyces smyrnaeus TaxID=1387713 RepID=A0ABS3Y018_9ACTN|nr:hypothetical protein [Streptomyces smyrnaeus]MBO8200934.1 hypothetical protein [Streptomyces smyrnaeus]
MKLPNRRLTSSIAVLAVAIPLSSAQTVHAAPAGPGDAQAVHAAPPGPGEWDDLGTHGVYYQSRYRTKAVKSGGGDFKACITTTSTDSEFYDLLEQDSDPIRAKRVSQVRGAGCWIFRNIGAYVDGDNNRAEFFIGTIDGGMKRVHYWD